MEYRSVVPERGQPTTKTGRFIAGTSAAGRRLAAGLRHANGPNEFSSSDITFVQIRRSLPSDSRHDRTTPEVGVGSALRTLAECLFRRGQPRRGEETTG